MNRIFIIICAGALTFMAAVAILGLSLDLHHNLDNAGVKSWATIHRLSGLAAAIGVVFAHSVVVTYFVGTSRWCKEVTETYKLDNAFIQTSAALKRRTFPWAVCGMLAAVAVVALGGAADPATGRAGTESWAQIHLVGALTGMAFSAYAFYREYVNIRSNHGIINEIVAAVRQIREAKGLDNG